MWGEIMNEPFRPVKIAEFGKDHWSPFGYLETCTVDLHQETPGGGELNHEQIRRNPERHAHVNRRRVKLGWEPQWGSRLCGYFDVKDPALQLPWHDDWDCIEDMEREDLLKIVSYVNGFFILTSLGLNIASALRRHKTNGGMFADFNPVDYSLRLEEKS